MVSPQWEAGAGRGHSGWGPPECWPALAASGRTQGTFMLMAAAAHLCRGAEAPWRPAEWSQLCGERWAGPGQRHTNLAVESPEAHMS